MSVKTAEQERNEKIIRHLYSLAEAKSKDTPAFVSQLNARSSSRVAVARTATVPRSRWTHREPHLRALLGFIGIADVTFIRAERLTFGADVREQSIDAARKELERVISSDQYFRAA